MTGADMATPVAALAVMAIMAVVLAAYGRRRRKQAAPLAARWRGHVSSLGDTVRFGYGGAAWEIRQLASGGGLGGTGAYPALVLDLAEGPALVLVPRDAMKYVFAGSLPRAHSTVGAASARFVAVGPMHRAVAAALDRPAAGAVLEPLFAQHYSTLQVRRETRIAWNRLPYRQWLLQLNGLPNKVYMEPDSLKPFLDNMIVLCGTINLCIDRRFA
jgi:hypothetical protein